MKRVICVGVLCVLTGFGATAEAGNIKSGCTYKGKKLYGKVKIVTSFADFNVKKVTSFSDLRVKYVSSFPDSCGKWKIVNSFPDFTVKFVNSFPDFSIKEVSSFPGL